MTDLAEWTKPRLRAGEVTRAHLSADVLGDFEHAYSTFKLIADARGRFSGGAYAAGTVWSVNGAPVSGGPLGEDCFELDPSAHDAGARTTRLLLVVNGMVNPTAPARDFELGLWPVPAGGGINNLAFPPLLPAEMIAASEVAFAAPAANALLRGAAEFDMPAFGQYTLGVLVSGATAANSGTSFRARLFLAQE